MFAFVSLIALALMASVSARTFTLTLYNGSYGSVYVILPWEMCGLTSSPPNQAGVWNSGWNVGTVYTVPATPTPTVITLNFALSSKSSHVLRVSKTYAGAQANDNSVSCSGFPITITSSTPSDVWLSTGYNGIFLTYYCNSLTVTP